MHNTNQLMKCGLSDEDISLLFLGVFHADQVPIFFPIKDWCLIANTDLSGKGGQHWIAFGSRWGEKFYFDSYGKKPSTYQPFWSHFDKWNRDDRDLQQTTSDICGDWCLYWCIGLARVSSKNKLPRLMSKFSEHDCEVNDKHVLSMIHSRFPRILNSTKHFNGLNAIIRSKLKSIIYPECLLNSQSCTKRSCLC